ncbi:trypsin-like serine peptidase [Actinospica robiniae]|uniref:trypsin-like serine peptidase n=1 Tax=Actinospica robiniae TaxID=304901 RepID=UPI00040C2372|nr:trypsin-like peptidase domain-containing protein [Actinospica robiniae]
MHETHQGRELPEDVAAPHVIIPGSDLLQVEQPTDDYQRCVGYLITEMKETISLGTGTLISVGDNYGILTAAHNVYDKTTQRAGLNAVFLPTVTLGRLSEAAIALPGSAIYIPPTYRNNVAGPKDYAIIALRPDQVPDFGVYPTMATIAVDDIADVQITGYPSQPPDPGDPTPAMYYGRGPRIASPDTAFLRYRASTAKGMSGSGVCRISKNTGLPELATVTGVHVDGFGRGDPTTWFNWAVYLTDAVIRELTAQITPGTT